MAAGTLPEPREKRQCRDLRHGMLGCSVAGEGPQARQSLSVGIRPGIRRASIEAGKAAELVSQTGEGADLFSLCHWSF